MVFLNPAVLFGLLAASIPVLIHLLNLKKLKKIEFSTLSFLKELQKNKIRKLKIKQWILLALRVLIILLIVTAFSRPTLEGAAIGGTTSAAKTTAVFILDDTYSMSVTDGNGTYLNQAKSTIKELLNQFQEGDEIALILVSDSDEEAETTQDLKGFIETVEETEISYRTGRLNGAIINAGEILKASDNFNKEIYLFTDFQKGRTAQGGEISDLSELLNSSIKLYSFSYGGKEVYNLGIDDFAVNTQIFEKNKPVSFTGVVTNYSERGTDNAVVSLFINGERSAQKGIDIGPGESRTIELEAVVKGNGYIDAVLEIEDDEVLFDNRRFASFYIPAEIPVIIFSEREEDSRFINLALSAAGSEAGLRVTNRKISQIASYNLNQFEAIILIGSGAEGKLDRLLEYTKEGGGLMLMPGENTSLQQYSRLVGGLGMQPPIGEAGAKERGSSPVQFDKIDYEHPLFSNIFLKEDKKQVESPDIYYYFRQNSGSEGTGIITLSDGAAFLSEYRAGKGKTLLFNTAPVLSWSNFPIKSIFVPLINKSVFYLASKDAESVNYLAGDIINITGAENSTQIKLRKPDGNEEYINKGGEHNERYISYNKTGSAGNYSVYSDERLIEIIPVNTDPAESAAGYEETEDFEEYLKSINFNGTHVKIDKTENAASLVMQARFGSELWKIFLFAALLLALIEMAAARSAKKDLAEIK